jgi:hypothetical protein
LIPFANVNGYVQNDFIVLRQAKVLRPYTIFIYPQGFTANEFDFATTEQLSINREQMGGQIDFGETSVGIVNRNFYFD